MIQDRIDTELHRIRVPMLDPNNACYGMYWAAQQALMWAKDPESVAPPFGAIMGSVTEPTSC
jgi:hypothetical protein